MGLNNILILYIQHHPARVPPPLEIHSPPTLRGEVPCSSEVACSGVGCTIGVPQKLNLSADASFMFLSMDQDIVQDMLHPRNHMLWITI